MMSVNILIKIIKIALIGGDHDVTLIDKNQVALQKIQSQLKSWLSLQASWMHI